MRSPIAKTLGLALLAPVVALAGCASAAPPTLESAPTEVPGTERPAVTSAPVPESAPSPSSVAPPPTAEAPSPTISIDDRLDRICSAGNPEVAGFVENSQITEASGIARATTHDGFWVLNDGGDARMFAIGPEGEDRGAVTIAGVQLWDLEDMARWDHDDRTEIVLADIGDNTASRSPVHPLVIAVEPEVGAETADARVVFVRYPDRSHNAEALVIDAEVNEVVIITKEESEEGTLLPAQVFAGSLEGATVDGAEILLSLVGSIDIAALRESSNDTKFHPGELAGVAGLVTGADVSADGRLILVRTYGSVWAWARPPGATVAETLLTQPCEAEPPFELQGEAIAFRDNTQWATLAEGNFASLRLSPR